MRNIPIKLRSVANHVDHQVMNSTLESMQALFVSEILEEKKLSGGDMARVMAAVEQEIRQDTGSGREQFSA